MIKFPQAVPEISCSQESDGWTASTHHAFSHRCLQHWGMKTHGWGWIKSSAKYKTPLTVTEQRAAKAPELHGSSAGKRSVDACCWAHTWRTTVNGWREKNTCTENKPRNPLLHKTTSQENFKFISVTSDQRVNSGWVCIILGLEFLFSFLQYLLRPAP